MARTTISPPRTSRGSPPARRHSSTLAATAAPTSITPTPAITTAVTATATSANTTTTTATASTSDTSTTNRSSGFHHAAAERQNIAIAPASSSTSSPIYSATSSPPISPGVSQQQSGSSIGTMGPTRNLNNDRSNQLAFDLAPTSTPTGRISKAKKGKRVHACEFPGCGKIFTRAEHRRRHELNHNPDASYRCQQPGCGKSFHRIDLLQRHQERHELEVQEPAHRRYPSQTAGLSEPPSTMPATSMSGTQVTETAATRPTAGPISIGSLVNPNTFASDPSFNINYMYPYYEPSEHMFVPDHTQSPLSRRYHNTHRPTESASSSVVGGYDPSIGSPIVPASIPSGPWPSAAESAPPNVLGNMFEAGMPHYSSSAAVNSAHIPLSDMDGWEWHNIGRELSTVPGLLSSPDRTGVRDTLRWHCLELYWQCFHPTYPIVHRPSFLTSTKPPPLLACAMVAIGSYYDTRLDAKQYSLALLEIATKILQKRPNITSRSRIVDLQTVVLLEILSTFCARQISAQMSTRFRALFANLFGNLDQPKQGITTNPLAVFRTLGPDRTAEDLVRAQRVWIEGETRTRILHACSVLDSQQTILFDQPPTVRRHTLLPINTAAVGKKSNLPCDDELWEASPVERWAAVAQKHEYIQLIGGKPVLPPSRPAEYSYFQQEVINANGNGSPECNLESSRITSPAGQQTFFKILFNYHATEMCKNTPIRNLLTVTGESWLLGRKIEKKDDYRRAKRELRTWLENTTPSNNVLPKSIVAHWHALKLLRCLEIPNTGEMPQDNIFGTTNMLHENWAVYLACLVCWAHGYGKAGYDEAYGIGRSQSTQNLASHGGMIPGPDGAPNPQTSTTLTCLNDPVQAATEALTYLFFTNVTQPADLRDLSPQSLSRTQGLLESVRTQKIAKYMMGGLMNDAEQVLLKLVEGKKSIAF